MSRLNRMQKMVEQELKDKPDTRSSDRELIKQIYKDYYGITTQSFIEVMDNEMLPSFETIRRTRQKAQELNKDLRAIPTVEAQRIAIQQEFIEYALEV